jgi:hypothetical protein
MHRRPGFGNRAFRDRFLHATEEEKQQMNVYSGDGNPTIPQHGNPSFRGMVTPPLRGDFLLG